MIFYRKGHSHCFLDNNSIRKGNFWHFQWMQTDQHQRKVNRCGEPVPDTKEGLCCLTFGIFYIPNVPTPNALLPSSYSACADQGTVDYHEAQGTPSFPHLWKGITLGQWLEVHLGVVVCENPGEDGVLHEVIVGSAGQGVQVHQILEVADFTSLRKHNKEKHLRVSN